MRKHRNQATYKVKKAEQETPDDNMITVQGDSLTVAEMLRRLSQGVPITGGSFGQYEEGDDDDIHESVDWEDLGRMDIIEQTEEVEKAKEIVDKVGQKLSKKKVVKEVEKVEKVEQKEDEETDEKL